MQWRHGEKKEYPFQQLVFDSSATITDDLYAMYADTTDRTVTVNLGNGVKMQVNQESLAQIYNNTGDTIHNGKIVTFDTIVNELISVRLATSTERNAFLGVATEDIPPSSKGLVVSIIGKVRDINTGSLTVGAVYLDGNGDLTNTQQEFPLYGYPLGFVLKTGVTDGIIQFRSDGVNFFNSIRDAFDGSIRETFDFRTFSDGVDVKGVVTNPSGDTTLTLVFSNGWYDYSVPDTINLIEGTSTVPQENYIYIDKETRTLQVSGSEYPLTEHAKISTSVLLDATSTMNYGALRNQNINDHFKTTDNNGHILHIAERIRVMNAEWEAGTAGSLTGTPSNVYIDVTAGKVWQMHLQTFPAQDMSTGDDIHVVNDPTTPYRTTTNLNDITEYSDGSTWNNEWANIVVWGICNKTGEVSHIMCNLPSDGYLQEDAAVEDADNFTNYTIPRLFRGVGFLIGRYTIRRSGANFTYNSGVGYLDLRGYIPNNTAGGGTGSSGITDYTQLDDTPSTLIALAFQRVNSGGTALENVLAEDILLTEFDSTGFTVDQSQVVGLPNNYILNVTESGNNISFTGVGSAFNGSIGTIAKTDVQNYFSSSTGNRFNAAVNIEQSSSPTLRFKSSSINTNAYITTLSNLDLYVAADDDIILAAANGTKSLTVANNGILAELDAATTSDVVYYNSSTDELTYGSFSGMTDPMTTIGDMIYRNTSNITSRLPVGSQDFLLVSNGTIPNYISISDAITNGTVTSSFDVVPSDEFVIRDLSSGSDFVVSALDRFPFGNNVDIVTTSNVFFVTVETVVIITNSSHTITFPTSTRLWDGRTVTLVNRTAGSTTCSTYSTISGSTSTSIPSNTSITVCYNLENTTWYQIN